MTYWNSTSIMWTVGKAGFHRALTRQSDWLRYAMMTYRRWAWGCIEEEDRWKALASLNCQKMERKKGRR